MSFIQIVENDAPFPWRPEAEDGTPSESTFTLKVLSDEALNVLRKKYSRITFKHGQRVDDFDSFGFAADVVDQAVVGWAGVYKAGTNETLPCERRYKMALPERVKVEVMRLCAGREAGKVFDDPHGEGERPDPNASWPSTSSGSGTSSRP